MSETIQRGWSLDRILLLVNMLMTLLGMVFYIGVEHQTIVQQSSDIARLERRIEYVEENGTRGTHERLSEIERRMNRTEDKIDTMLRILK